MLEVHIVVGHAVVEHPGFAPQPLDAGDHTVVVPLRVLLGPGERFFNEVLKMQILKEAEACKDFGG